MDKVLIISYLANFVIIFKNLVVYAIIGRIIVSWFTVGSMGQRHRVIQFLYDVTDPFINIARLIPHRVGMMDFAPLIAMFGVDFLGQVLVILLTKLV